MKKILQLLVVAFVTVALHAQFSKATLAGKWTYLLHVFKGSESGIGESPVCTGSKSEYQKPGIHHHL